MKIRVATDLHLYGPHQIGSIDDLTTDKVDYLLGDIIDMKCVKKSEVEEAKKTLDGLVEKFGDRYLIGNHELLGALKPNLMTIVESEDYRYLLSHGHVFLWSDDRIKKWLGMSFGMSFIGRWGVWIANKFREIFDYGKLKKEEIKILGEIAISHKCDEIIIGHVHSKEEYYYTYEREGRLISIHTLPRGITEVDLF